MIFWWKSIYVIRICIPRYHHAKLTQKLFIYLLLSLQVLAFGSVPLKTYLPDGDIDITAFSHQHLVEDFAGEVCSILEREGDSEFQVKDVQYINAQVLLS